MGMNDFGEKPPNGSNISDPEIFIIAITVVVIMMVVISWLR